MVKLIMIFYPSTLLHPDCCPVTASERTWGLFRWGLMLKLIYLSRSQSCYDAGLSLSRRQCISKGWTSLYNNVLTLLPASRPQIDWVG